MGQKLPEAVACCASQLPLEKQEGCSGGKWPFPRKCFSPQIRRQELVGEVLADMFELEQGSRTSLRHSSDTEQTPGIFLALQPGSASLPQGLGQRYCVKFKVALSAGGV